MSKRDMPNPDSPLVALRLKVGLTQKDLAEAFGVYEQTVRNWEHGKVEPKFTLADIKKLCRLLNTPLSRMPDSFAPQKKEGQSGDSRIKQLSID